METTSAFSVFDPTMLDVEDDNDNIILFNKLIHR